MCKPGCKCKNPFHVVAKRFQDKLIGYDIYRDNQPFMTSCVKGISVRRTRPVLRRSEAYAIVKLLNEQVVKGYKWAPRFGDPYVARR